MSTKLITILIIALVVFLVYRLFVYWEHVRTEQDIAQQEEEAALNIRSQDLPGLPYQLEGSLSVAQRQGPDTLKRWLELNGRVVQDPRRAWIELDYCTLIARDKPVEAREVFASVKQRIRPGSPVHPRVVQLEETFE